MNPIYKSILFFFGLLWITSCEKIIQEVNIPDKGRKIVMNAVFTVDSLFKVDVTKSQYIMENDYQPVNPTLKNVVVDVYENNVFLETLSYSTKYGCFLSEANRAKVNTAYKVVVKADGLPTAESSCLTPVKVPIISFDTTWVYKDEYSSQIKCNVKFNDAPQTNNYYYIELMSYSNNGYSVDMNTLDTTFYFNYQNEWLDSDDLSVDRDMNNQPGLAFSDDLFDGKTKDFTFSFHSFVFSNYGKYDKLLYVRFHAISKEYYFYLKSYFKARDTQDFGMFVEPVQVFNNIENGYGILGGQSTYEIIYTIPPTEYPKYK